MNGADSSNFKRVADRARTGDRLDHNQELYQLSYSHHAAPNLPGHAGWHLPELGQGGNYLLAHELDRVEVAVEEVLAHDPGQTRLLQLA